VQVKTGFVALDFTHSTSGLKKAGWSFINNQPVKGFTTTIFYLLWSLTVTGIIPDVTVNNLTQRASYRLLDTGHTAWWCG
jgi:hypothetical protein